MIQLFLFAQGLSPTHIDVSITQSIALMILLLDKFHIGYIHSGSDTPAKPNRCKTARFLRVFASVHYTKAMAYISMGVLAKHCVTTRRIQERAL